jgi:hypothetical protein
MTFVSLCLSCEPIWVLVPATEFERHGNRSLPQLIGKSAIFNGSGENHSAHAKS